MSFPQAYHTSCRKGLGGQPGFQFNAASPSLDPARLNSVASSHTGYHAPRGLPLEPSGAELADFPVALKVTTVDGVGPVASRTTYVGREFRGRGGAPDEGRFGNYFSHVVIGHEPDAFDGLLGVELWGAPHWCDEEVDDPALVELPRLEPGPLDLPAALALFSEAPAGVAETLLDAASAAIDGGPRVVVVEPDAKRRVAWLAWLSFALPPSVARRLTFTTFSGRPRYALDVHVCMTTPSCDIDFAAHELGQTVVLIDAQRPALEGRRSLYARTAQALAQSGPDVLADAVRAVDAEPARTRGVALAVVAEATEVIDDDDVGAVLELLVSITRERGVEKAAALARSLPGAGSNGRELLLGWGELHRCARLSTPSDEARELAAAALERIVPFVSELPSDFPDIPGDAPTSPAVGSVAAWLSALESAAGSASASGILMAGAHLGLVGINSSVDRRVSMAITADIEQPGIRTALDTIAARPGVDHIVVAVTEALADAAEANTRERGRVRAVAGYPAARAALEARATRLGSFDAHLTWLRAAVERDPRQRRPAAKILMSLANDFGAEADIRELWGPEGPSSTADHIELVETWLAATGPPPRLDVARAWQHVMSRSLLKARSSDDLPALLTKCKQAHGGWDAWWCACRVTKANVPLVTWQDHAMRAFTAPDGEVPTPRQEELLGLAARVLVRRAGEPRYLDVLESVREIAGPARFRSALVAAVDETIRVTIEPAVSIANMFRGWCALSGAGDELLTKVLPDGLQSHRKHDDDVADRLDERRAIAWRAWVEEHPRGGVGTALKGAFRRRSRNEDDA
jgi:hypothetical protein